MSTSNRKSLTPKKSKTEDEITKNLSKLSIDDKSTYNNPNPYLLKKDLVVVTTSMATSNGTLFLNVKTMNSLRIRTGDPVVVYPAGCSLANGAAIGTCWPPSKGITMHENRILMIFFYIDNIQETHLDSTIMENCDVSFGEQVTIEAIPLQNQLEAGKITLQRVETEGYKSERRALRTDSHVFQMMLAQQLAGRYFIKGNSVLISIYGKAHKFHIVEVVDTLTLGNTRSLFANQGFPVYKVSTETLFIVKTPQEKPKQQDKEELKEDNLKYSSIGGLSEQIRVVREMVEMTLHKPHIFAHYGLRPPKGILLFGPPGTGKTLIARVVAKQSGAKIYVINGPEFISSHYGESETRLRDLFTQAEKTAPALIFIDELDAICGKREDSINQMEMRVVATLLTLMDGVGSSSSKVIVIGATNRPNSLDPALRRPGRFDREIEIGIPNAKGRREILSVYLKTTPNSLTEDHISHVSSITHGYVGADIAALCKEAALKTLKRSWRKPPLESLVVSFGDMMAAFNEIRPSAMREIVIDVPKVLWTDIGGYSEVKQKLQEAIELPLKCPEAFARMGISPPKGILLYGPPGCSKTLMAKALATEAGLNFLAVKGPELFSKWVGESERAVQEVFRKARAASPSVIFFDEIDALAGTRGSSGSDAVTVTERVLTQLLNEMDGIVQLKHVTVVAATNRPDILDKALLRPGRIDAILYISPPDLEARKEILKLALKKIPHSDNIDIQELAILTEGYSGAELTNLCREASLCAMKQDPEKAAILQRAHFTEPLTSTKPGITQDMLQFYRKFQASCGAMSI